MRVITFKVDERLLRELDAYCIRHRKPRSEVIRTAVKEYLDRNRKSGLNVKVVRLEEGRA
jgi:metal-responsive CopG/Arc/MetJ family transcriptional regulator